MRKKAAPKPILECPLCKCRNIITNEEMRVPNGPKAPGKKMTNGSYFLIHYCVDCANVWSGGEVEKK